MLQAAPADVWDSPQNVGRRAGPVATGPSPGALPAPGTPERWRWLRALRGHGAFDLAPWLEALETGALDPAEDLLAVLAERLDPPSQLRLLRWWGQRPDLEPALAALLVRDRDPATALWLRRQLLPGPEALQTTLPAARAAVLLPLLGHQRRPQDWPLLRRWLQAPLPTPVRRAALEGLALGLAVWPRGPLAAVLGATAADLDPRLAAAGVDLLARLPGARRWLQPLARAPLEPAVADRVRRRLAALPASPLLLVVHGRAGGALPAELIELALELEARRGAPVRLQALTAAAPPPPEDLLRPGRPLTLVPLLLLPGVHVRLDLPAIARHWRRFGPVRRLPFLGAWPGWQAALGGEVRRLRTDALPGAEAVPRSGDAPPGAAAFHPVLLHHPLAGVQAARYLALLERVCGARTLAVAAGPAAADPRLPDPPSPLLPLALAGNRLTERLGSRVGPPLLGRPALRRRLLEALEALP